jgi:hypothetical protein
MSYSDKLHAIRELVINAKPGKGEERKEECLAASQLLLTPESIALDQGRHGARLVVQWVVSLLTARKNEAEDEERKKQRILMMMDERVWTVSLSFDCYPSSSTFVEVVL